MDVNEFDANNRTSQVREETESERTAREELANIPEPPKQESPLEEFHKRLVEVEAKTNTIPEWKQPQGAHDAYPAGATVSHNGQTWSNTHGDGNVWEPGVYGWAAQ